MATLEGFEAQAAVHQCPLHILSYGMYVCVTM